ncbi:RHS repeat domain-containing protein [Dyadobacter jiangsuensis]|uniref:RHS repeat-associated protein n=1 Tax=Dyadobacter jiangsuensis TaxID=1591085 RepID=A0A2P8G0C9_9BACT|nr:RHS repeat-associated core domain-containing protein [Dyadobacter jiangsuensis]PSL27433.1 RHS repeat-associated protein [Dyadobacter jiangsuensis]
MFIVKRSQLEAFRQPMREIANADLIQALRSDGFGVTISVDKSIVTLSDESGSRTVLQYNQAKLLSGITKQSGAIYELDHDHHGRLKTFRYPDGSELYFKFDSGQLRQIGAPGKNYQFAYDGNRLNQIIYPGNKFRQFFFDDFGAILASIDRMGETYQFHRNEVGQIYCITDPSGKELCFEYDQAGLLAKLIYPDKTEQSYLYDEENDTLFLSLRDGQGFSQRFDGELITELAWENGPAVQFGYDSSGILTSINNDLVTVKLDYNEQNQLIEEDCALGKVRFGYDSRGRLSRYELPSGLSVEYEFNTESQIVALRVAGQSIRYVYNDKDLLTSIHYPNGLNEYQDNSHVQGLQRTSIKDSNGQVVSEQLYEYDSWDRLSKYRDAANRQDFKLIYDDECHLTALLDNESGRVIEYFEYDTTGNLNSHNGRRVGTGLMNEIGSFGNLTIRYDPLGNLNSFQGSKGEMQCFFARNGILTEVATVNEIWRYTYDGIGRRIEKTDGVNTWKFGWSGSKLVVEEHHIRGVVLSLREYIYLPDNDVPIGFYESGRLYWMQSDVRGAIIRVFDTKGQLVWHASYSAFGETVLYRDNIRQPWRLMGQYEDAETGLHYNLARYYCPWLATYLSLDPEWLNLETLYYGYARNDPYNRSDPYGNVAPLLMAVGVGALVGGVVSGAMKAIEGGGISEIAGAAASGALSGVGATLGGIVGFAVGGPAGAYAGMVAGTGAGGFLGSMAGRAVKGEDVFTSCALQGAREDAMGETAFAAALPIAGKVLGPVLRPIGKRLAGTRLGTAGLTATKRAVAQVKGTVSKLGPGVLLAGKPIKRVKRGNPRKVAVIGRRMKGHVEDAMVDLESQGVEIELFNKEGQKKNIFDIDGKKYRWSDIENDFANSSKYTRDDKGWIEREDLPETLMYKANKQWAEKLKSEGYTVIDMGYPDDMNSTSLFYDIETRTLFD